MGYVRKNYWILAAGNLNARMGNLVIPKLIWLHGK
jgi:hypothetical protein